MTTEGATADHRETFLRLLRLCYWRSLEYLNGGPEGSSLTDRQGTLLRALLEHGPLPPRHLCPLLGVTPADVTGLSDRLATKGLLRKLRSEEDRRVVTLTLTPQGERAARGSETWRARRVQAMLTGLSSEELRTVQNGLESMLRNLGPVEDETDDTPRSVSRGAQAPRGSEGEIKMAPPREMVVSMTSGEDVRRRRRAGSRTPDPR
ncbi:MAG: MarR family transcriptional regulator [Euryarchaeota archaeon]|nr:MarR family transcriptional regulator [Euryarchaeota archaeon]MDE1836815.1 MarR family transcriptional regulator [Euryarchaeota archaeon]MDE1881718.1 MarR family transcriptional regulator [Euryarchaeota archaeon]MDE2044799.1 MarR family transcriptional regulator [Thermoplasmata archaeon]